MRYAQVVASGILAVMAAQAVGYAAATPKLNAKGYTSSAVCGQCHAAIYAKWRNSLHAMSFSDPIFEAAFREVKLRTGGEAQGFCLKCHAPTVVHTADLDLTQQITREGVTCDFCHTVTSARPGHRSRPFGVEPGLIKRASVARASSPAHKTMLSGLHTTSEFCGACHELKGANGVTIMGTYSEWRAGPYAGKGVTCQHCHMPKTSSRTVRPGVKGTSRQANLHDLQGGHSIAAVQKAARVRITELKREGDRVKGVVSVSNVGSGHKIPTGVPSRKLVLRISARTTEGLSAYGKKIVLQKVMGDKNGAALTNDVDIMLESARVLSDNRLSPGETRKFSFAFPVSRFHPLAVEAELTYCYQPAGLQPEAMIITMAGDRKHLR